MTLRKKLAKPKKSLWVTANTTTNNDAWLSAHEVSQLATVTFWKIFGLWCPIIRRSRNWMPAKKAPAKQSTTLRLYVVVTLCCSWNVASIKIASCGWAVWMEITRGQAFVFRCPTCIPWTSFAWQATVSKEVVLFFPSTKVLIDWIICDFWKGSLLILLVFLEDIQKPNHSLIESWLFTTRTIE